MIIEKNQDKINSYLNQSNFQTFFSFDIQPYIEVHSFHKKETICQEGELFPLLPDFWKIKNIHEP
jgi:CRP/FNR family putative post-exponential-phase nitrogen-starvation transcriptional regulator